MAFTIANLYNVNGMPPGFAQYVYKSDTDDREDVMASGYFNNDDDDLNLASDDMIRVTGNQGFYTLRVDTVSSGTVTTELAGQSIWLQVLMANVSSATSSWTVSPVDGLIRRMITVANGKVTDDTTLGLELGNTNVTDTLDADIITIATSGGAAGDVDTGEADTANAVSEGTDIEVTCGGEGSGAVAVMVLIEIVLA